MDFIEQLPSSSGFTAILVVVDQLLKQAIFIPTYNTITSMQLAQLFILHVFSKHGVPSHVTSDCGTEFVSHFFMSLRKALDMRLHFTSRYHPEGNRQTKRTNQTLEIVNISTFTAAINRTTGKNFFHSRSLHTTMLRVLLQEYPHSSPTRDIIRTSLYTLSANSPPHELKNLRLTSTNYTKNSDAK